MVDNVEQARQLKIAKSIDRGGRGGRGGGRSGGRSGGQGGGQGSG